MKVLIPIDDSECSWDVASSISKRTWPKDVEFRIVTVMPVSPRPIYAPEPIKTRQLVNNYGQQIIDGMVAELRKVIGHAQFSSKVLIGGIASSIVQEAEEWGSDLIIMGTRERNKFLKFIFGSISSDVSKQVDCKVEIIKTSKEKEEESVY